MNEITLSITAVLVPDHMRLGFLPKHFGIKYMMVFENLFYTLSEQFIENYQGAYLEFYELSNGGCYCQIASDAPLVMSFENHYSGEFDSETAGLILTLYAINQLIWIAHSKSHFDDLELFTQLEDRLKEFAASHGSATQIFRAID